MQWDARDALIRQSRADGLMEVNVRGIDGLPVGGIRDFKEEARGLGSGSTYALPATMEWRIFMQPCHRNKSGG